MSLAIVYSRAQVGMDAPLVTVEVHLSNGLPGLAIVGLAETAVKESKDRVRGALLNSRFEFPARRITINLAPADLPKEGGRYDLPIAIGILAASGQVPANELKDYEFAGELALSGELRAVRGILPMALQTNNTQRVLAIPLGNAAEANLIKNARLLPAQHLLELTDHLNKTALIKHTPQATTATTGPGQTDLTNERGQLHAATAATGTGQTDLADERKQLQTETAATGAGQPGLADECGELQTATATTGPGQTGLTNERGQLHAATAATDPGQPGLADECGELQTATATTGPGQTGLTNERGQLHAATAATDPGQTDLADKRGELQTATAATGPRVPDLADVRGQLHARRALEIAAAGGHSLLMLGPPGTGKSLLASRLPGILPEMTDAEALEAATIASISHLPVDVRTWKRRAFRAPHHTASAAALVGGGSTPRPGEITLAHHGVLFLDELPEFNRHVLEVLREPMESGRIIISRAARQTEFPARFQLIAAMNPCPCGYLGDPSGRCHCSSDQVQRYRGKISGPLLDRVDMHIEVPRMRFEEMQGSAGESSATVRERVSRARALQHSRNQNLNSRIGNRQIEELCVLTRKDRTLLQQAMERLHLSARAYHRTLKLARTIADLDASADIRAPHLGEAINYRKLDRSC